MNGEEPLVDNEDDESLLAGVRCQGDGRKHLIT